MAHEKDWVDLVACFTKNAVSYSISSSGVQFAGEIASRIQGALQHRHTVHHIHVPIITVTTVVTGKGIWPMQHDLTGWPTERHTRNAASAITDKPNKVWMANG